MALLLAMGETGFRPIAAAWILGFINYFCRILVFVIIIRAILSWFAVRRTNIFIILLDEVSEPILAPLRRVVPRIGIFDISPLIAILVLYLIPRIVNGLYRLFT
jgi:YggT family protein